MAHNLTCGCRLNRPRTLSLSKSRATVEGAQKRVKKFASAALMDGYDNGNNRDDERNNRDDDRTISRSAYLFAHCGRVRDAEPPLEPALFCIHYS